MATFQIKEKMFSLGGKFTITDQTGLPCYHVEGSLFPLPKTFKVFDEEGHLISQIEKKVLSFLPKFNVTLANGNHFTIKKENLITPLKTLIWKLREIFGIWISNS